MASGDSVQQIKDRLSIVDVVAPYVELHAAGKNMKGKSPFTNEKTPSFYVSPDRGMYYCFSSSQGGDIFTFVEKMEGVDFKGALKILADKAGVELVPEDPKSVPSVIPSTQSWKRLHSTLWVNLPNTRKHIAT
ncbi:MAG: CHC2 zinc finger domain-containing protein [Candidatus Paceibacterota bacterium]